MLKLIKYMYVVVLSMVYELAADDMFHYLTADTSNGYGPVVFGLVFLTFIEGCGDVYCSPIFKCVSGIQ